MILAAMLTLALATAVAATPRPVLNVQPAINVIDSIFLSHGFADEL
jgi:hypothetical protein